MSHATRWKARERLCDPHQKRELNEQLFSVVAPRYDAITRLLSFDRDRVWKTRMVEVLPALVSPVCLDLACGTGDITFRLASKYPDGRVIGIDLTEAMLEQARTRCSEAKIQFRRGDMDQTGCGSESVDIVTGSYALRNAGDLRDVLTEIYRVLKPGGLGCFLDFSKPHRRGLQKFEGSLLRFWGGLWGWVFHRDPSVYTYIAKSLVHFPDRRQLATTLRSQGFEIQASQLFFCGIVQLITVRKPGLGSSPPQWQGPA